MPAEDRLAQLRGIVCADAVDEILHMFGLSIARLLAGIDHLVGGVENLVATVRFDFHIPFRSVEGNKWARGMLGARDTLIGDLFATFELP